MKELSELIVLACSPVGKGLSGGDRIFIELSRNISKQNIPVEIITWKQGVEMMSREGLTSKDLKITTLPIPKQFQNSFFLNFPARVIASSIWAFKVKDIQNEPATIVYSASDFWMDVFPTLIIKSRFKKTTWVGSFYLKAPNPFRGFKEKGGIVIPNLKNTIYFLMQLLTEPILKHNADIIFVTSKPDEEYFPRQRRNKKIYIVKGGVKLDELKKWKRRFSNTKKKYDAIFMGRFHPQKGVIELVDIWERVVENVPSAKLVMIGDGPLMNEVKVKIRESNLSENIFLKGYVLDGEVKYRLFSESKIFVHPVVYDSGGMSAAEGMAWDLPVVCYDLESLKTYYPKGAIKVGLDDKQGFANAIVDLLSDKKLYRSKQEEAQKLIEEEWDFQKRSKSILTFLQKMI